jgi:hypothetical protein
MSEEISKYRIVKASQIEELEDKMNILVEQGYRYIDNMPDENNFFVIMGLRSTPDLQLAKNFVNLDIATNDPKGTPLIEKMTEEGWKSIANYSRHVTLMKVSKVAEPQ